MKASQIPRFLQPTQRFDSDATPLVARVSSGGRRGECALEWKQVEGKEMGTWMGA